jgi:hypothetical protein
MAEVDDGVGKRWSEIPTLAGSAPATSATIVTRPAISTGHAAQNPRLAFLVQRRARLTGKYWSSSSGPGVGVAAACTGRRTCTSGLVAQ